MRPSDVESPEQWGGLSWRAVKVLQKLGYRSLHAAREHPPDEEDVFWTKGVCSVTLKEIGRLVPVRPDPRVELRHPPTGTDSPLIKGVPVSDIIKLWKTGFCYSGIQRRHPQLTWADITGVVHGKTYSLVQARLAEGKTTADIARELRCSPANVWIIKQKMERNRTLRRDWGGLSPRAVKMLKKLGYKSLHEILKDPPSEEKVFWIKGVGRYTFEEIKNVVPLKPSPGLFSAGTSTALSPVQSQQIRRRI